MTAEPRLVFVHGWGFDSGVWGPIRDSLSDIESETVDLGFFGTPAAVTENRERPVIAVGHSLGFLWLLHERPFAWRALVSIGGMPRFAKAGDYGHGVGPRVIDAMIARFNAAPAETLAEFLRRSGCADAPISGRIDRARLTEGLRWLKEWDERETLAADRAPVLALHAADDAIVPTELSKDAFAARPDTRVASRPDGGHALPLSEPRWCAAQIREFVECVA